MGQVKVDDCQEGALREGVPAVSPHDSSGRDRAGPESPVGGVWQWQRQRPIARAQSSREIRWQTRNTFHTGLTCLSRDWGGKGLSQGELMLNEACHSARYANKHLAKRLGKQE